MKSIQILSFIFNLFICVVSFCSETFAGYNEVVATLREKGLFVDDCSDILAYPAGTFCYTTPSVTLKNTNVLELRIRKAPAKELIQNLDIHWIEVSDRGIQNFILKKVYTIEELEKFEGAVSPYLAVKQKSQIDLVSQFLDAFSDPMERVWKLLQLKSASGLYISAVAKSPINSDFMDAPIYTALALQGGATQFSDVLSPFHSRVKIPSGNFIHANTVEFSKSQKFIATQNPMLNTKVYPYINTGNEFWSMVVHQNVSLVVNLTKEREGLSYWPDPNSVVRLGGYTLKLKSELRKTDWIEREIEVTYHVKNEKGEDAEKTHSVTLLHYQNWQDGEASEVQKIDALIRRTVELQNVTQSLDSPVVVHCMAGVGRTGTFIARKVLLERLSKNSELDLSLEVMDIVSKIRYARGPMAVARPEQLKMLFVAPNQLTP